MINICVYLFTSSKENDRTFLAVAAHHSQDHLLQRSIEKGRDADAGVLVSHR
jgi:hypothetical protein